MRRRSWSCRLGVLSSILVGGTTRAATLKEALDAVPPDTLVMVCVPSPSGLEAEILRAVGNLALGGMLPPSMASPLTALRGVLQLGDAFDADGAMVVGVLSATALAELPQRGFFLLPAKDPKALIAGMGGQPGAEEGVWSLSFIGSPSHAAIRGKHVVVAQSPATAKAAAADAGRALGDVMSREDLDSLVKQDVFLWIKLEDGLKLAKPQIDLFMSMSLLAQSATGPAGIKQAEATKKQIDVLLQGLSTCVVGMALEEHGVALRFAVRARPGSELDQTTRRPQTAEPLLRGVSAERYLFAAGSRAAPEMVQREIALNLRPQLAVGEAVPGVDKAKYAEFARSVEEWAGMVSAVRVAVVGAGSEDPEEDGLLGVVGLIEASDSRRWIELFGQGVESMKALFTADGVEVDGELKSLLSAARWSSKTEELGGTTVARLLLDFSQTDWRGGAESRAMKAILGGEGLCARVAMIDEKTVAVTLGGGRRLAEKTIESGRGRSSAIEECAGVRKTATALPRERQGVAFLAVDRIVNIVPRVVRVFDEAAVPELKMAAIETPVGMTSSGGEHVTRLDVFMPDEVLVAVKDAALAATSANKQGEERPK